MVHVSSFGASILRNGFVSLETLKFSMRKAVSFRYGRKIKFYLKMPFKGLKWLPIKKFYLIDPPKCGHFRGGLLSKFF